jgi:hypothetical protein
MRLILLLAALAARPNPALTPGVRALGPDGQPLSVATLCSTKWGKDVRHVTESMKIAVARRYGVEWPPLRKGHRLTPRERALRAKWEVDHWYSRENGGADDIRNLWMQPIAEAHQKDVLENRLHRAVCAGTLTLDDAIAQLEQWGAR